jgi:hypothetical protein
VSDKIKMKVKDILMVFYLEMIISVHLGWACMPNGKKNDVRNLKTLQISVLN